jgi:glycosyltransferase involved in cell wall biosynthesis
MNILAYVHLRNIYASTGAGRVARQMIEHIYKEPDINLQILADPTDYQQIIHQVGEPWTTFNYRFIDRDTSQQQAYWLLFRSPTAETFWSDVQIVYCAAESYVPTQRAKSIVTLHDAAFFEPHAHSKDLLFIIQSLKWKYLYSVLSRKVDIFHTVSKYSAERIAHYFPQIRDRIRVIYNAVPPRFFLPPSDEGENFLKALNLDQRPYILLPRGLYYRKNADLVLQVWPIISRKFPDLFLVISSHCDPSYAKQAKALGNSSIMTGFVSDEALCSLYTSAQLTWFPSRYEGFGLPVLESMACGTPVIASNNSSLPEVGGDAAILINTISVSEHVEAISSLLVSKTLRNHYSELGKIHAQRFTWKQSAAQLRCQFEFLL